MCDLIETPNGDQMETAGELRAYLRGLDYVAARNRPPRLVMRRTTQYEESEHDDESCLCGVDIGATLERHMVGYRYDPLSSFVHFFIAPDERPAL